MSGQGQVQGNIKIMTRSSQVQDQDPVNVRSRPGQGLVEIKSSSRSEHHQVKDRSRLGPGQFNVRSSSSKCQVNVRHGPVKVKSR